MTCEKCSSSLIYLKNKFACPRCNDLKILNRIQSIKIAKKRISFIRQQWKKELSNIHRDSLLFHIVNNREMLSWDIFQKLGIADTDQLFSDTLFIKRVLEDGNKHGKYIIDNNKKFQPINNIFSETKRVETDLALVDSENAVYLNQKQLDIEKISDQQALTEFVLVQTEEYEKLLKNYEKYNLVTREMAETMQKKNAEEFRKILQNKSAPTIQTREQFIERNYQTICSFYMIFLRNEIYSQVFDLRKFKQLMNDPTTLMNFIKKFPLRPYTLNGPNYTEFLSKAKKIFHKYNTKKLLIFEDGNLDIFPLFVRVNLEGKDIVLLSKAFCAVIFILLHAVLTKDIFDAVSDKLGLIFEKNIQKKFESLGYDYLPNHKDNPENPTLEIDGIASKNDTCYVIECKNHKLPPEVESFQAKQNMIDDLRGIVDGFKRTTKDGKRIKKPVPSLVEKVNYVKQHLSDLNLKKVSSKKIFGLIVTDNYPLISNYKEFNIISNLDISDQKLAEFAA